MSDQLSFEIQIHVLKLYSSLKRDISALSHTRMEIKHHASVLLVLLLGTTTVFSQTQDDDTRKSLERRQRADEQLAEVVERVRAQYEREPEFIEALIQSQEAWKNFRTAELRMKFPKEPDEYGSVYDMCVNDYLADITEQRITQLRVWLDGTFEGDVCAGSVDIR